MARNTTNWDEVRWHDTKCDWNKYETLFGFPNITFQALRNDYKNHIMIYKHQTGFDVPNREVEGGPESEDVEIDFD